jgi:ATPase family associated with various cellular activities (AAA)
VDFEVRFDRLGAEFPNATAALARLRDEAHLRAAAGAQGLSFRPSLLAGPPGVGKSRFARRLAAVLGLPSAATSLAGASDSRELEGTARGWATAQPCWALDQVAALGVANPLLIVDEVDKCARETRNGDPLAALLPFLEPGTAAAHRDPVLGGPCDLSAVSWVLAANDAWRLPGPLLSRLRVVEMGPPPPEAFAAVLAAIRGDIAAELGCALELLPALEGAEVAWLERRWRETRSPRVLRKLVERLLGVAAARRPVRLN